MRDGIYTTSRARPRANMDPLSPRRRTHARTCARTHALMSLAPRVRLLAGYCAPEGRAPHQGRATCAAGGAPSEMERAAHAAARQGRRASAGRRCVATPVEARRGLGWWGASHAVSTQQHGPGTPLQAPRACPYFCRFCHRFFVLYLLF